MSNSLASIRRSARTVETEQPTPESPKSTTKSADAWPAQPSPEAFHGVAGEFVRIVSPHSEADPVALLIQFLVAVGNLLGRTGYAAAESSKHHANLFAVLVGKSAKGRKGSSWSHVRRLLTGLDEAWASCRVANGLSSGEGLIWQVRDPIEEQQPVKERGRVIEYQTVVTDPGVADKRLLVIEEEFANTLKVMGRETNTLSPTIRQAWDTGTLRTMTKNYPAKGTNAHVSIIGHITRDELRSNLADVETTNGFGNRFLWCCVGRSKSLPDGGNLQDQDLEHIQAHLRAVVSQFTDADTSWFKRDSVASKLWHQVYPKLTSDRFGLLGAMTARAEAQVLRLSVLFAMLDMANVVEVVHLQAALAVWDYCERSAAYIFGHSLGNRAADTLLAALREAGTSGLTKTQIIHDVFARNRSAHEIADALRLLQENGLAGRQDQFDTDAGRSVERWIATTTT